MTEQTYAVEGMTCAHCAGAVSREVRRIEGVSDLRDESNREGVRIVIDLKRDATPEVVLNQLWRHTPAQSSFAVNMLALRGGRPEQLSLRDVIEAAPEMYTRFDRDDVVRGEVEAHRRQCGRRHDLHEVARDHEYVAVAEAHADPAAAAGRI